MGHCWLTWGTLQLQLAPPSEHSKLCTQKRRSRVHTWQTYSQAVRISSCYRWAPSITYCRSTNLLVFDCEPEVLEGIDGLLELNLPISKIFAAKPWFIDLGGCDQLLRKVVKYYQSKLTELTLNSILYTGIIRDCMRLQPNLISFSAVDVSDGLLNELGKHCRNLQSISLCNSPHVSDAGFTALFAGVFNTLKVIICSDVPLVTACTLFNILHFRIILKKFTWSGKVGFDAFDVAEFVRKARNWQLVPLPVMLCTVKSKQRI